MLHLQVAGLEAEDQVRVSDFLAVQLFDSLEGFHFAGDAGIVIGGVFQAGFDEAQSIGSEGGNGSDHSGAGGLGGFIAGGIGQGGVLFAAFVQQAFGFFQAGFFSELVVGDEFAVAISIVAADADLLAMEAVEVDEAGERGVDRGFGADDLGKVNSEGSVFLHLGNLLCVLELNPVK